MNRPNQSLTISHGAVLIGITVGCLILLPVGATAAPATASATGPESVSPGETATVSISISNTGEDAGGYVGDISLPEGWTVSDQTSTGAIWNAGDRAWLWQGIQSGDTVNPSVTIAIPNNQTSGSYDVGVAVKSSDGVEANATHTIAIQGEAVDSPADGTEEPAATGQDDSGPLGGVPLFGIALGIAGVGAVGYVVSRIL